MCPLSRCVLVALLVLACLSGVSAADGWHQFQKDEVNTGITSDAAPRSDPELVWSMQTGAIDVPPIIAGDLVYVYDANGTIRAFDRANGNLVWRNETSPWMLQSSTPAYGNGEIFVAERDGNLHAFDAATGECLWKAGMTDYALACPVTYYDHRIYIGESYCREPARYFCYGENGTMIWSSFAATAGAFEWCGASVVGDYLIYPISSGHLISLFRENGTLSGEIDLADTHSISFARSHVGRIRASVSHHDGYVYVTSENSTSEGYLWKIRFDDGKFIDDGWSAHIGFSTSTPVIYDGRVYVGQGEHGYSGNLTCLNDSTGAIIWSYPVSAGVKSSSALSTSDDGVYIYFTTAMTNGSLYCLRDCGTFATLAWEYNPPDDGYILQGVAISDGLVYFGTGGGYVYCIGRRGDLNHDGLVTAADAVIALQMAVGAVPAVLVGDMDGDGRVTSLDALIILQ
ncbi:MAG: PQQ-binding-like beta-propeller repeat protein [Euryarchaeota archaeon]|nr:PQQ-binding-like beta-propeller repeat protein [Euryarchaeota archaeon]